MSPNYPILSNPNHARGTALDIVGGRERYDGMAAFAHTGVRAHEGSVQGVGTVKAG